MERLSEVYKQAIDKIGGRFWPKKQLLAKRLNSRFSIILAGTRSIVIVGHFFNGPDGPTKSH